MDNFSSLRGIGMKDKFLR